MMDALIRIFGVFGFLCFLGLLAMLVGALMAHWDARHTRPTWRCERGADLWRD